MPPILTPNKLVRKGGAAREGLALPAMAAGVSERLWEIGDIVKLVEDAEPKPSKRGPYKNQDPK